MSAEDVQEDIVIALKTQQKIYKALERQYSLSSTSSSSSSSSFSEKALSAMFANVFATVLVHPWRRDADGMGCARDVKQLLWLDHLDTPSSSSSSSSSSLSSSTSSRRRVKRSYLLDVLAILKDAAYPPPNKNGTLPAPSPSHVHLLRLLMWNLGLWEIYLDTSTNAFLKSVEDQLNQYQHNPYHPFQKALTVEDVVHGHPSPMVLAVLFAVCARFTRFSEDQRQHKDRMQAFMNIYDSTVVLVTHPVFLAQLLKFRGEFLSTPEESLLYILWHLIDIARWSVQGHLYTKLLEYGTATAITSSPILYPERHFWKEYDRVLKTAKRVARMGEKEVQRVRETVLVNHMGRVMG